MRSSENTVGTLEFVLDPSEKERTSWGSVLYEDPRVFCISSPQSAPVAIPLVQPCKEFPYV